MIQNKSTPSGGAASLGNETCHAGFTRSAFNAPTAGSPNYDWFVLQRTIPVSFGYPLVVTTSIQIGLLISLSASRAVPIPGIIT